MKAGYYSAYSFHVEEPYKQMELLESKKRMPRSVFKMEGKYYSPFSGKWRSIEKAEAWLEKHGRFWAARGHKLILMKFRTILGYARGTKLMITRDEAA